MKKFEVFFNWIDKKNVLLWLVFLIILALSVQTYLLGPKEFEGKEYTHYNNYQIFTQSFWHILEQQDLYQLYPEEHWDYFKYSPTFSMLMAPFAVLPDWLGLTLWNLLNGMLLFLAIFTIPGINRKQKSLMVLFIIIEMITSLRNNQSNGLMAAMVIFTFNALEDDRPLAASLFLAISVYIKLFTVAGLALMLLYPSRFRFLLYFMTWMILLGMLPLIAGPFDYISHLYESWFALLGQDHAQAYGLSVMGWLYTWFELMPEKNAIVFVGMVIFLLPFFSFRNYRIMDFRLKILASVLLWMVIFNHMAESPTFIIAMTGVALWFFSARFNWLNFILLITALLFTSFTMTDFFPAEWRDAYVKPYVLKTVPCILIWIKITIELLFFNRELRDEEPVLAVSTTP